RGNSHKISGAAGTIVRYSRNEEFDHFVFGKSSSEIHELREIERKLGKYHRVDTLAFRPRLPHQLQDIFDKRLSLCSVSIVRQPTGPHTEPTPCVLCVRSDLLEDVVSDAERVRQEQKP